MTVAPEIIFRDVIGAWRADTLIGDDLVDLSGNGRNLGAFAASYGTTNTADGWGVGGVPVALANGISSQYAAVDPTPWGPIHQGTGCTIWFVARTTHAGIKALLDTGAYSIVNGGGYVQIDGDLGRIGLDFTKNPADEGRIIDYNFGNRFSWKGTFASGVPHAVAITISIDRLPNIQVFVDGELVDAYSIGDREKGPSTLGSPHPNEPREFYSGPAGFPLHVFAAAEGILITEGELAELGVTSSAATSSEIESFWQWATARYGIRMATCRRGRIVWNGDSLVDNVWRTGQFPEITTDMLLAPQTNLMRAVVGTETNQLVTRYGKHVVPSFDPDAPFNIAVVWGGIENDVPDGPSLTPEQIAEGYRDLCLLHRAQGYLVVAVPEEANIYTPKATWQAVNDIIRAEWSSYADVFVDFTSDPNIGDYDAMLADWGGGTGPKIYRVDGVHFTDLGNRLMAPYFARALNQLIERCACRCP